MHAHRRMRLAGGLGIALALAMALFAASASAHTASAHADDEIGHVYVDDNTASTNTIAGFTRHANGSLTPLPGSPFSVGGAGLGAGAPEQGALHVASDGESPPQAVGLEPWR